MTLLGEIGTDPPDTAVLKLRVQPRRGSRTVRVAGGENFFKFVLPQQPAVLRPAFDRIENSILQ